MKNTTAETQPVARALRNAVTRATADLPTLQVWLDRMAQISPLMAEAVEGIWTGRDGTARIEVGTRHMLVVGWHRRDGQDESIVEYAYLS